MPPVAVRTVTGAAPDTIVLATGAQSYNPQINGGQDAHIVIAWQVLQGEANVGARGHRGFALQLGRDGHRGTTGA